MEMAVRWLLEYYRFECYRAAQSLKERADWDGRTLVVTGGSQLIVTAGRHPKIMAVLACVPAGCDINGPVAGRLPTAVRKLLSRRRRVTNRWP